jgi:predicted lysophospholipase L1 biosynthesis ABC-type transport system permease subunit
MLGGGRALGRRFRYVVGQNREPGEWFETVGVVGDLAMNVGNSDRDAGVYHPRRADEIHPMRYIIDVGENPNGFLPRLRTIASEVDPDAIIQAPQTLADVAALSRLEIQLAALMAMSLSGIGALLAAAALYALMAFTVSQRTREIGIRIALGAGTGRVLQTIAHRAAVQLAWGVVFGAAFGAWILSEIAGDREILEFNLPGVLVMVSGAVVLIVCIACSRPILRGLKVDPTDALREG